MAIKELLAIIEPPSKPLETGSERAWARIQKKLGMTLPLELRELVSCYGSGSFTEWCVEIFNPFSVEYAAIIDGKLGTLRRAVEVGLPVPYPIHPSQPGLFPWGRDEHGGAMYWLTEGPLEEWPIILRHRSQFERWEMPLTMFLAKAFKKKMKTLLWPTFKKRELVFSVIDYKKIERQLKKLKRK